MRDPSDSHSASRNNARRQSETEEGNSDKCVSRYVWIAFGYVALALAMAGIPLPLLPTTPFLLLAVYCFGRGSPRLQQWLLNHPTFGPPINRWRERGAISTSAKRFAIAATAAVFLSALLLGAPKWALMAQAAILVPVSIFILTRPSV